MKKVDTVVPFKKPDNDASGKEIKRNRTIPIIIIQSNLAIRNFLVTLKLFLNAKSSLLQKLNQNTI